MTHFILNFFFLSAQALVRVLIGDKNDNPPVFEKPYYETNVLEQPPDSSKSLIRVHATDKDDGNTFQLKRYHFKLSKIDKCVF